MAGANRLTGSVRSRHPGSFGSKKIDKNMVDPDDEMSEEEGGELELWRLLPQLRELPEDMLRKLPVVHDVSAKQRAS